MHICLVITQPLCRRLDEHFKAIFNCRRWFLCSVAKVSDWNYQFSENDRLDE